MQIPPTSAAAQAAGIVAQAASKESGADASPGVGAAATKSTSVEKSNEANADRDAQGQGDGLPGQRRRAVVDELDVQSAQDTEIPAVITSPPLGEPPSQLDIVG